jgi:hypothetical protein
MPGDQTGRMDIAMTTTAFAEHLALSKIAALYLALIAIHLVAPDRDADRERNDWLAEAGVDHRVRT